MGKLALTGGKKTVTASVSFKKPAVSERAMSEVMELMKKGEISISPTVAEFEEEFASYIGTKYCIASTSGTSSLHEALFAVGVSAGDEVIVPSFTFVTSVTSILAARGVPVFCDVDRETQCIDPEDIKKKITSHTKAIMPVHVWGNPCNMDAILDIAKQHGLAIVEDCSHAHGAEWKGKKVGSIGNVGAFSLQGGKHMPAGEGGVLTTNDANGFERAALLGRLEKIDLFPEDSPNRLKAPRGLGFKHRPHPLGIAIARDNLRTLDEFNAIRNKNGEYIDKALTEIPCITPQKALSGAKRVYAYHLAFFDGNLLGGVSREVFLRALAAEGVECGRVGYGVLHEMPLFEKGTMYYHECCLGRCPHTRPVKDFEKPDLPETVFLRDNGFTVAPRFECECNDVLDQYIESYQKVAASVDELKAYEKEHPDILAPLKVSAKSVNLVQNR